MSLKDSIDLVLYAFEKAKQGDIFIQKASASTVGDLAKAVLAEILTQKEVVFRLLVLDMAKNYSNPYFQEKRCREQKI